MLRTLFSGAHENNGQLKTIDKKKKIDCIIKLSINDFILASKIDGINSE